MFSWLNIQGTSRRGLSAGETFIGFVRALLYWEKYKLLLDRSIGNRTQFNYLLSFSSRFTSIDCSFPLSWAFAASICSVIVDWASAHNKNPLCDFNATLSSPRLVIGMLFSLRALSRAFCIRSYHVARTMLQAKNCSSGNFQWFAGCWFSVSGIFNEQTCSWIPLWCVSLILYSK